MPDNRTPARRPAPYRVAIVTLDAHAAGPAARAEARLTASLPGLELSVHAAAEWGENPAALDTARAAIAKADIVVANMLFLEEHIRAVLPDLQARRETCDAMVGCIAAPEIVTLTSLGGLDMSKPASGALALLKRLRGSKKPSGASGEKQMRLLRRLPRILRFIPGKAQDLRAYFLTMQYWLGGSTDNIEAMVRFLVSRYAARADLRGGSVPEPVVYPDTGLYHPRIPGRIGACASDLPDPKDATGTVGLLLMRSYVLAGDTAHYDAVIEALESKGLRVLPAFAAGLDARPAIDAFFRTDGRPAIDALVSLTGFSLVGGPAYNDSDAATAELVSLDVPYVAAHALEFQTLGQWTASASGLGPVETTMLVALPEIDGATNPIVYGGRIGPEASTDSDEDCVRAPTDRAMQACSERTARLAGRVAKLVKLRRSEMADRRVAIVLYGFPPNAGAVGTAAHLSVFESLFNTLHAMKREGYDLEPPASVDELRERILSDPTDLHGQPAQIAAHIPADKIVRSEDYLKEIEAHWGPAPGRHQTDGRGVFVLGAHFGNVFVGVQPTFGFEGDPMRLLFEKGFAPTHAFAAFYRWLREDFSADVVLHFGMHGALEFMPGKQAGLSGDCWPDRLIGDMPNVYLYAANNPSEATLAKRRSGAVIVSHLTPPLAQSGLYKGLLDLKESLERWRSRNASEDCTDLETLIREQAAAVDLDAEGGPDRLWLTLLETEQALIPDGLHVVGAPLPEETRTKYLSVMRESGCPEDAVTSAGTHLQTDMEMPALLRALGGRVLPPVPGGDLIRSPDVLPTGRNMHAFDPFRMPTAFALREGARQAERLLERHDTLPRSIAMVLWGSDNIKSDGGPIAQALALIGAKPRFDGYGRLAGADLVPLAELGRPRIDVVMTLSGIFRDLLPLQTKMLAEAAYLAATADEPTEMNFVRAHALDYAERMGVDMEQAALRVFSNAEGTYGSNVNQLIDTGAWGDEDELADAYENRKSFAYGRNGVGTRRPDLLKAALKDVDLAYQNLESVELGVTTVDHYFDTLGGISRAVRRVRGVETPVYIGDQTRGTGKVRTLREQVALETRTRSLNPKWFEGLLKHGHEGVRQIEAQVTNTLGWSATTGQVDPWVYKRLTETFVLDEEMRRRLAELNPQAGARVANRLLEAHERSYWEPDEAVLEALRRGADELEDNLEGIGVAAE
ncbi:MAG: magnesium chelatase subunit H [Pseudomonadota bacterium]